MLKIQVRKWKTKEGLTQTWRLVVEEYTGNTRHSIYPAKSEYFRYGLNPDDTLEKAREKLAVVRSSEKLKREGHKRATISARLKKEAEAEGTYLPRGLYVHFLKWLKGRRSWDDIPPKTDSHLRCMRRLILDVSLDPAEWARQPGVIYQWFIKQRFSVSYLEKVLPLLNEYGYFYCAEMGKAFLNVVPPPSRIYEKINDTNYDARGGRTNESKPLSPASFEQLGTFSPECLRWLRLSLYFGLRPIEVDGLTPTNEEKKWRKERDTNGTPILAIYQSKLINVPRLRRWKRVPALLPEQVALMDEIGLPIKRPYSRYIQKHLGEGYTLYAGRKGFEPLMRSHGQSPFNIFMWKGLRDFRSLDEERGAVISPEKAVSEMLGHSSLTRTANVYSDPKTLPIAP